MSQHPSRLPNTFLVGAPKCGTTYLSGWLGQAADVFAPGVKEPGFFGEDRHYARGLDHYAGRYYRGVGDETIVLDSTPWYLYPRAVPARIAQAAGGADVKILVVVRDPVARAVSMYYDQISRRREPRSLRQAVEDDLAVDAPQEAIAGQASLSVVRHYVLCGLYAEPVGRYLDTFGAGSVRVLRSEQLWADPEGTRSQLEGFLGVGLPPAPERAANPASRPALGPVEDLLTRVEGSSSRLRAAVARAPRLAGGLRRGLDAVARWNQVPARYPRLEPELDTRLRRWYEPANQRLGEILGQSFDSWSRPAPASQPA